MTDYVLDNSVSMRWLLGTGKQSDLRYAVAVSRSMRHGMAWVPNLWHLEVANALLEAVNLGTLRQNELDSRLGYLERVPVMVDPLTAKQALQDTLALGATYGLTSYDAAYLELAMRRDLPLATLDRQLARSAVKAGVPLHLRTRS